MGKWLNRKINEITISDAYDAWVDGVNFICGDGKLKQVTSDKPGLLVNILMRRRATND